LESTARMLPDTAPLIPMETQSPLWPVCFGLWVSIGINGAVSGSIRAAALTRSAHIPPTRAPSIAVIFPPICSPLEGNPHHERKNNTGTVSQTVSKSRRRLRKILAV